jgi:hypothetical protein
LWHYEGVGFSKVGHLKETLERQVEQSEAGKTHDELETQLKVRVHNSLLDLVRLNKISRQIFQGIFLYLSIDPARAKTQREHRNRLHLPGKHNAVSDWTVIEVLAQIIRSHRLTVNDQEIATALCDRGICVTALQVAQILKQMDVKKTLD